MNDEEFTRPFWWKALVNRFVIVPALLVLIAGAWNIWVLGHDHGLVAGRVVDAQGHPVEGATVTLWVYNFTTFDEKARRTTAADGSFTFSSNPSHNIELSAEKPGLGRSTRVPIRLYFRAEDTVLKEPLKLAVGN